MRGRVTGTGALAVLMAAGIWMVSRPPTVVCGATVRPGARLHEITASKIVVRPWLGPHQVYGIFVVPNRFMQPRYTARLAVYGFESWIIRNLIPERSHVDPTLSRPGHYLEKAYVPTRVALRLLFTGHFGDLRTPCQWQLGFVDAKR